MAGERGIGAPGGRRAADGGVQGAGGTAGRPLELASVEEVVALDPPRSWRFHGVGGLPVTGIATGTIEPLDGGARSRVTIALDFQARGIGRLLVLLVIRRQARRQLPRNQRALKTRLERGG
jgi:GNAT superfamily N-acetyltransferase